MGLFVKICYADYNDNFSPDLKLVVKYDDLADCPKNDVAIDSYKIMLQLKVNEKIFVDFLKMPAAEQNQMKLNLFTAYESLT